MYKHRFPEEIRNAFRGSVILDSISRSLLGSAIVLVRGVDILFINRIGLVASHNSYAIIDILNHCQITTTTPEMSARAFILRKDV